MNLHKEDIEILDSILDEIINEDYTDPNFLVKKNIIKKENAEKEFLRLLSIMDYFNCAECTETIDSSFIRVNKNSYQFHKNGGFKKLYEDQQTEKNNKNISDRKTKKELELTEKVLGEYWVTKWTSRLGFAFSVILIIIEIFKAVKK